MKRFLFLILGFVSSLSSAAIVFDPCEQTFVWSEKVDGEGGNKTPPLDLSRHPAVASFQEGRFEVQGQEGRAVEVKFSPAMPADAPQLGAWFADNVSAPSYPASDTYKDWWTREVKQPTHFPDGTVWVLRSETDQVLGAIAIRDLPLAKYTLSHAYGVRVHPAANRQLGPPRYRGVGKALYLGLLLHAVRSQNSGVTVTSSKGAEFFYEKLGLPGTVLPDGRTRFMISDGKQLAKHINERLGLVN